MKIKSLSGMPMRLLSLVLLLCCTACNLSNPTQPLLESPAAIGIVPTPNVGASENTWQSIAVGIEQTLIVPPQSALAQMIVVRLDPTQVLFRVHYQPADPLTLDQWRSTLPDAQIIVNTNFFTPENTITGLLVSDGQFYGSSFTDRGGMFSVQNGQPAMQSLVAQPYDGRALEQAVQAFPMLVVDGMAAYTRTSDTRASRRTVIGMDSSGRVLLFSTPGIGLGLYDLSQYLASSDLELQTAFNLDGGGSTMLSIAPTDYRLRSFDAVPSVLAVYSR